MALFSWPILSWKQVDGITDANQSDREKLATDSRLSLTNLVVASNSAVLSVVASSSRDTSSNNAFIGRPGDTPLVSGTQVIVQTREAQQNAAYTRYVAHPNFDIRCGVTPAMTIWKSHCTDVVIAQRLALMSISCNPAPSTYSSAEKARHDRLPQREHTGMPSGTPNEALTTHTETVADWAAASSDAGSSGRRK